MDPNDTCSHSHITPINERSHRIPYYPKTNKKGSIKGEGARSFQRTQSFPPLPIGRYRQNMFQTSFASTAKLHMDIPIPVRGGPCARRPLCAAAPVRGGPCQKLKTIGVQARPIKKAFRTEKFRKAFEFCKSDLFVSTTQGAGNSK